jgi:hypothetical protein
VTVEVLREIVETLDRLVVVTQAVVPYLLRIAAETEYGPWVAESVTRYLASDALRTTGRSCGCFSCSTGFLGCRRRR